MNSAISTLYNELDKNQQTLNIKIQMNNNKITIQKEDTIFSIIDWDNFNAGYIIINNKTFYNYITEGNEIFRVIFPTIPNDINNLLPVKIHQFYSNSNTFNIAYTQFTKGNHTNFSITKEKLNFTEILNNI